MDLKPVIAEIIHSPDKSLPEIGADIARVVLTESFGAASDTVSEIAGAIGRAVVRNIDKGLVWIPVTLAGNYADSRLGVNSRAQQTDNDNQIDT